MVDATGVLCREETPAKVGGVLVMASIFDS